MPPRHFRITKAQQKALFRIFQRDFPSWVTPRFRSDPQGRTLAVPMPSTQWRRFRKTVVPAFCGDGSIMVPWKGLWLGVERDGYTHS